MQDSTNWYIYCLNNPMCFVDPTGLNTDRITVEGRSWYQFKYSEFKQMRSEYIKSTTKTATSHVMNALSAVPYIGNWISGASAAQTQASANYGKLINKLDEYVTNDKYEKGLVSGEYQLIYSDDYKVKSETSPNYNFKPPPKGTHKLQFYLIDSDNNIIDNSLQFELNQDDFDIFENNMENHLDQKTSSILEEKPGQKPKEVAPQEKTDFNNLDLSGVER